MRFSQSSGTSAADLVNSLSENALAKILWEFGEERFARRIAKHIIKARPIQTTGELVSVIRKAAPGYETHLHPATRTFQALRIATIRELATLSEALPRLVESLAIGGKIAVISFHSLEDRLVKEMFKKQSSSCICPRGTPVCICGHKQVLRIVNKKVIKPSLDEIEVNPRSRSAKLRVAQKI